MLWFFLAAGLVASVTLLVVLRPIMMGGSSAQPSRDATDAALYRDQLAELDRDVERGVITPKEAEGAKAEIARRLIAAAKRAEAEDDTAEETRAPGNMSQRLALGAAVATPLLAGALYFSIGAPGEADRPLAERNLVAEARAERPTQAEAEAAALAQRSDGPRRPAGDEEYAELVEQLEAVVAERPDDARGNRLLANALMNQRRFAEAWPVLDRLIALEGDAAPADLHAARAEAMILAAGGYVSPRAEDSIAQALQRDPTLPVARYYAGLAMMQTGMEEQALALWARLERESPPDAPWMPLLREVLAEARAAGAPGAGPAPAGIDPALLPPPAGAPAGVDPDIAAAVRAMSPEEQMAFMASRAAGLEERLLEEGGGPDEWAMLVQSYANLGQMEDALRAYDASQEALRGAEAGFVRERALVLGVIEE
ncbi:MAG: c-type cytochrome biogenesis protein CcmI [Pseudomonadota bacterium]